MFNLVKMNNKCLKNLIVNAYVDKFKKLKHINKILYNNRAILLKLFSLNIKNLRIVFSNKNFLLTLKF